MRAREPFTLVKRRRKNLSAWMYRCYDASGRRLEYSTGLDARTVSKTAARAAVADLFKAGKLIPPEATRRGLTFGDFAQGFFASSASFATRRAASGSPYSGNYLAASASALEVHLLPAFKKKRLAEITTADIEKWTMRALAAKDEQGEPLHSPKTVRNTLAAMATIMDEAKRRGLITSSPCDGAILPSKAPRRKRDALRPDEIAALLDPAKAAKVWKGQGLIRAAVIVSLGTGARLGEVRALRGSDVHKGWLEIARSWSVVDGEKGTKSGRARTAPLPRAAQGELDALRKLRGDGLLFTLNGKKPISTRYLQERFGDALEAAGITREAQEARALSFHCLRVTFNTFVRGAGVTQSKLEAVVGHSSKEMSDRYTAFAPGDLGEVKAAAEKMLTPPKKKGGAR